ncbi:MULTISPECIES: cell division ATP-binding protein FtsE [Legionella]|uniref:Cell division ATP-binding protein FtsE n=1 Tax=Legionella septentrionalis TaxID=2498109 RepID=A0A433JLF5_9GAMM|nr:MULTISPECIES: cell division ATP-binding protein FtsE [Legionella]MCP0914592.1 cell division ATP-binding protein FtsE [Legionella sp. 27cVA30]RUQ90088.1 cell division ATP-binding protein FtsE [Legionella septentrionalis]RUQ96189.1 cell division ATP-binding protein FtsE [Legionella septentrionalis]RUR09372.1 cell division ATP-binding protein FtsE [Legionella septentrionalis]RUR14319.1 cell division ATP-binding protein FtsE [Legionella septentrionalis]
MITFNQVSKRYPGGFEALSEVSFSLEKGEMAFLTGPSGAGKSTLLKLIGMLELPTAGQIIVNGTRLNQLKKHEVAHYRCSLGIIFQSPHLLNDRTVFENVALPLQIQGYTAQMISKRVHAALDMVGLLSREKMLPLHLSGGEQQRVGIARAVVHKPSVLLADEPTGNLDPTLSIEVIKLFEQFNQVGVSVIVATHDLALIAGMRHRIVMLKGGRLC